jgi:hypothetical protein
VIQVPFLSCRFASFSKCLDEQTTEDGGTVGRKEMQSAEDSLTI